MKNAFLLIAICLTAHLSFGQDRREGLRRLSEAREIRRDVLRHVNRNINRDVRYDVMRQVNRNINRNIRNQVWVNSRNWRGAWRNDARYRAYGYNQYDGRQMGYQIRDEIRREMRITRDIIRNEIRSAFRFWRD